MLRFSKNFEYLPMGKNRKNYPCKILRTLISHNNNAKKNQGIREFFNTFEFFQIFFKKFQFSFSKYFKDYSDLIVHSINRKFLESNVEFSYKNIQNSSIPIKVEKNSNLRKFCKNSYELKKKRVHFEWD